MLLLPNMRRITKRKFKLKNNSFLVVVLFFFWCKIVQTNPLELLTFAGI